MHFQKFLLDNYIASSEGKEVYDFFCNIQKLVETGDKDQKIIAFINSLLDQPVATDFFCFEELPHEELGELEYPPFEEFEKSLRASIEYILTQNNVTHRDILGAMPQHSLQYFFFYNPGYAFPYLYPIHFNILQDIFKEFNIYIPQLPGPRKYKERCFYYIELCRSVYDFRQKHKLSPEELCTFLYGFAPKFISRYSLEELPQANKVWIVGASKEDSSSYLPSLNKKSIFYWSGKENMRAGDIVFIYELNPQSRIRYMARAYSDGYDDPFQYYSGKVLLCDLTKIHDITFQQLKDDTYFSTHSLIKIRMLGLGSGREISNLDYVELKRILSKNNFDIAQLPETISYSLNIEVELNDESDVEKHLLETFLAKLGIQNKHITRQMPLRMGQVSDIILTT